MDQNGPKINPKNPNIDQKFTKNLHKNTKNLPKWMNIDKNGPTLYQKWTKYWPNMDQKQTKNVQQKITKSWPTFDQNGSNWTNNLPEMDQKYTKNIPKMNQEVTKMSPKI